jgi:hypothetical protein
MCRYLGVALGCLLCAACGGSPNSPGLNTSLILSPGAYRLVLYLAGGTQTCNNGICTTIRLCSGDLTVQSGVVPVVVSRQGDDVTVRQEDGRSTLLMMLIVTGDTVTGTIGGRGIASSGVFIDVFGPDGGTAQATGAAALARVIQGSLIGSVTIGGASCSGEQSLWRLEPG